jgi:hypothetical protein
MIAHADGEATDDSARFTSGHERTVLLCHPVGRELLRYRLCGPAMGKVRLRVI